VTGVDPPSEKTGAAGAAAGSLWAYALELYGRPGAEARFLELQDAHGPNICFLIWSLWLAAEGRPADAATLAAGAALARSWEAAAVEPLRRLRRQLKTSPAGGARRRERLRAGVQRLELDAERMLLEMLEDASPAPSAAPRAALPALQGAVASFGGDPPAQLLSTLAALSG
jgi:uncharacterized protein (TIGR02444 family)